MNYIMRDMKNWYQEPKAKPQATLRHRSLIAMIIRFYRQRLLP